MKNAHDHPRAALTAIAAVFLLSACSAGPGDHAPGASTSPPEAAIPPASRPAIEPAGTAAAPAAAPPVTVPPGTLYVCVVAPSGAPARQTPIELAPNVEALCRKHPELGPCQYERNNCRASGGRVFTTGSTEITMATEAEYDKKVMRTRFRAN